MFLYCFPGEEKFLQQLAIEEQFGVTIEEKEMQKERLNEKKGTGAAIGYNYNDPGAQPSCSNPIGRINFTIHVNSICCDACRNSWDST